MSGNAAIPADRLNNVEQVQISAGLVLKVAVIIRVLGANIPSVCDTLIIDLLNSK